MSKKPKLVYCLGFKLEHDDQINKFVCEKQCKVAKNLSKNVDLIIYDDNDEKNEEKISNILDKYGQIELKKRSELVVKRLESPSSSSESFRVNVRKLFKNNHLF